MKPPKNLMIVLLSICLFAQSLYSQEKCSFPEFRFESGLFASSKEYDRNPSTGEFKFYTVTEYGFEAGLNCRIAQYCSASVWGDAGFFGPSMIFLSQLKIGTTFLYGDQISGFAGGPVFAAGTLGKMIGGQVCFKKVYLKCLVGRKTAEFENRLLYAWSGTAGYTFGRGRAGKNPF